MTSGSGASAGQSTGAGADAGSDGSLSTSGAADEGGSFIDAGETSAGGPQANGATCSANTECESGFCYTVPGLGGVCSECLMDQDCGTGTCTIDAMAMYAVCSDGGLGVMCNTDEGCGGELVCTQLVDVGALPVNTDFCSECGPSAPCADGQICSPVVDAANFAGYMHCIEPGTVANDGTCPVNDGVGDNAACMSNHCVATDVYMGLVSVGVCGACEVDTDCEVEGQTCTPGGAGNTGLFGSTCVDPPM